MFCFETYFLTHHKHNTMREMDNILKTVLCMLCGVVFLKLKKNYGKKHEKKKSLRFSTLNSFLNGIKTYNQY